MENQYNYYNSDGMNGNGQSETPFHDDNGGQKHQVPHGKKPQKKIPKAVAVTGFALLFGVVSSGTFLATKSLSSNASLSKSSSVVTSDVSSIVENVMPSIVSITNMSVQQVQDFFGGVSQQQSESAGTGIIISQNDSELLVVTNNHVVAGSDTLTVTFDDGTSVEANIKGTNSEYDIAVVAVPLDSISDDTMKAISVATLGDSTQLKVGEPAIAIGNALGYGQSVTTGIVSATRRTIDGFDG